MEFARKIGKNLWLVGQCRDVATLRALKGWGRPRVGPSGFAELRLRCSRRPVLYRPGTSDVWVMWEVYYEGHYELARRCAFRSVVDCGANIGLFACFAGERYGEGLERYVGVEADAGAFAVLGAQVRALGLGGGATLLRAAVWDRDGTVRFMDEGPTWMRRVAEGGGVPTRAVTVERVLDEAGLGECDLLKLDVEGAEGAILPGIGRWGGRVRAVVCELHGSLDFDWFERTVAPAGFRAFREGELFRCQPAAVRGDAIDRVIRA